MERLRHAALKSAPAPGPVICDVDASRSSQLVAIMSNADPRARQEMTLAALNGYPFDRFVCQYREATNKMESLDKSGTAMPDVVIAAREASVQVMMQALLACGRCAQASLLKTVAAGSAITARMYPEALRLIFELMETSKDFRDVYESVQKTYAVQQRGKGEVSLGSPR